MTRKRKIDIYNELDNFVEENEGEVTHTEIARHFFELGRNNAIDKACEWLHTALYLDHERSIEHRYATLEELLNDFRKAMKGD